MAQSFDAIAAVPRVLALAFGLLALIAIARIGSVVRISVVRGGVAVALIVALVGAAVALMRIGAQSPALALRRAPPSRSRAADFSTAAKKQ